MLLQESMLSEVQIENHNSAAMRYRKRTKRVVLVIGLCIFAFTVLSQVRLSRHETDQRITYKITGSQGRIKKIRERERLLAESEKSRDLDAERRLGIGKNNNKKPVVSKKKVISKLIILKDKPVINDDQWVAYERNITHWIWRPSRFNVTKFRNELHAADIDIRDRFLTSNATRRVGGIMTTYLTRENITMRGIFTKYQDKVSPFKRKPLGRCSVVGNSGLLVNSNCGSAIDSADYVFRINVPEMDPYVQDVGYKTNFTTLNPSIFKRKYNYFASKKLTAKFNTDMSQFQGLLMLPCFSDDAWIPICSRALQHLTLKKDLNVTFGDPEQFSLIRDYWVTKGLSKYPSTGLYLATAAIVLCDEVHLYGFWPFVDSSMPHVTSHPVNYHYFDDTHMVRTHDMRSEFNLLTRLHKDGVLRIHIEGCAATKATDSWNTLQKNLPPEHNARKRQKVNVEKLWENIK